MSSKRPTAIAYLSDVSDDVEVGGDGDHLDDIPAATPHLVRTPVANKQARELGPVGGRGGFARKGGPAITKKKSEKVRVALNREANAVKCLAKLSFVPVPQRWARDKRVTDEELLSGDPDLVSHVVVMLGLSAFAYRQRAGAVELREELLRHFATVGLQVCQLQQSSAELGGGPDADAYYGMYALPTALIEEKRNIAAESILSWHGENADMRNTLYVSPAEKMMLTDRIINRAIEYIREQRDEDRPADPGVRGPPTSLLKSVVRLLCPKASANWLLLTNVRVQFVVKDVFGVHDKRVRSNLVRLFSAELRRFCCLSCRKHYFTEENEHTGQRAGDPELEPSRQRRENELRMRPDLPPFIEFCDEMRCV